MRTLQCLATPTWLCFLFMLIFSCAGYASQLVRLVVSLTCQLECYAGANSLLLLVCFFYFSATYIVILASVPAALRCKASFRWLISLVFIVCSYAATEGIISAYFRRDRILIRLMLFYIMLFVHGPIVSHVSYWIVSSPELAIKTRRRFVICAELLIVIGLRVMQQGAPTFLEAAILQLSLLAHSAAKAVVLFRGYTELEFVWKFLLMTDSSRKARMRSRCVVPDKIPPCAENPDDSCGVLHYDQVRSMSDTELDTTQASQVELANEIFACLGFARVYTLCLVASALAFSRLTARPANQPVPFLLERSGKVLLAFISEQLVETVMVAMHHFRSRSFAPWDTISLWDLVRGEIWWLMLFCTSGTLDVLFGIVIPQSCPVADESGHFAYLTMCSSS